MDLLLRLLRTAFNLVLAFGCAAAGLTVWLTNDDFDRHMRAIPSALHATGMSYRKEDFGGIGPGANEAGVVVYPLPAAVVGQIERQGMAFFDALGPDWSGWGASPVVMGDDWGPAPQSAGYFVSASPLELRLNRYPGGGEVSAGVSPDIRDRIDAAITQAGSYYAFRPGGGLIIVNPARAEAYFVFSG